jgi:hypothetical protein
VRKTLAVLHTHVEQAALRSFGGHTRRINVAEMETKTAPLAKYGKCLGKLIFYCTSIVHSYNPTTMSNLLSLTTKQLRRAVSLKQTIETLSNRLDSILGTPASGSAKAPKKRSMSAAGRAAVAAAQKARWAKIKRAKKVLKTPAKRRKMSAAARAKIAAAAKARWAKVKAAGKKSL